MKRTLRLVFLALSVGGAVTPWIAGCHKQEPVEPGYYNGSDFKAKGKGSKTEDAPGTTPTAPGKGGKGGE